MNALPLSYYNFSAASYVPRSTEVGKDDSLTRIIFVVAIIIHRVPFQGLSILRRTRNGKKAFGRDNKPD